MNKTGGYIAGGLITLAVLVIAAWLPSLFATNLPPEPSSLIATASPLTRAEKAELTRLFVARDKSIEFAEYSIEEFEAAMPEGWADSIDAIYGKLSDLFFVESQFDFVTVETIEGVIVTNSYGQSVRLLWIMHRGERDWNNWRQIIIDADTSEIYFFYSSSQCLRNKEQYIKGGPDLPTDPIIAANQWQKINGFKLFSTDWNGVSGSNAMVTYLDEEQEVKYQISCYYYRADWFNMMVTMQGTSLTQTEDSVEEYRF